MKISVAIAALNEGAQLQATVSNLLACARPPDEIVVVDDNSFTPQVCHGARVIRNKKRLGSGPAKHKAAARCKGDLIVVMDGHMRVPVDFIDIIADEHRRAPLAILSPPNHGIESHSKHNGRGGEFKTGESGFFEVRWATPREAFHSYAVPVAIGGCYCIPKVVLDSIGGYAPGFVGYGVEEEYLALRAWICGFECRVTPRTETWHYYRRPIDRRSTDGTGGERNWEMSFNRRVAAMVCFEDGVYERVYRPRLDKAFKNDDMARELAARAGEIAAIRAHIQKTRTLKDADLLAWCGVSHPSP